MTQPALAIVVSTIGRPDDLRRLLTSVEVSACAAQTEVVVVDQSADRGCVAVVEERRWAMPVRATTSARGASRGRNVGLRLTSAPVVLFPDDDAWYPAGGLDAVRKAFEQEPFVAAVCGRQVTSDGRPSMLRWRKTSTFVSSKNFLRTSIMSTMFFRRHWLDAVGPFDEDMGVGTSTWYGAGEESDLLLRVIEAGGDVLYEPDLLVLQEEPRDEPTPAFVAKMLRYGCGHGHLWRKRRLPSGRLFVMLARKVVAAAVRAALGRRTLARADLAWVHGIVCGMRDVPPRALRTGPPS